MSPAWLMNSLCRSHWIRTLLREDSWARSLSVLGYQNLYREVQRISLRFESEAATCKQWGDLSATAHHSLHRLWVSQVRKNQSPVILSMPILAPVPSLRQMPVLVSDATIFSLQFCLSRVRPMILKSRQNRVCQRQANAGSKQLE